MTEPTPPPSDEPVIEVVALGDVIRRLTGHDVDLADPAVPPVPSRLIYADELVEGQVVDMGRACTLPGHNHQSWCSVLRIRSEGQVVSAILLDEHGEQRPGMWNDVMPVRVQA